ncbi:HNH endonuclease signature motif containing protein [Arthrobacter bambusae]|uniref:HNH nuclease domain-containing protein n=1 Tax=Arthrobacter bambusae TaxID=1338426 RepID=A0AAW8DG34_9MICC|nr:HNH endonuclease signature motif containing protein [Arthrobacter bambusae]MDP9904149.1 hypothetical protein [Arthrobacter bambusae]MDQ0127855.1 hypothetical protein [Arthrobacter bambusae]MDQ0179197.1 hypothetical protein [Arthrobacter bambusae]
MEGIGQLVAPRAAAPDGRIPSPGRLSRRLKPVPARHAQLQFAAQFQNPSQVRNPSRLQNPAAVPTAAGGLDRAVAAMDALRSTAVADARSFGFLDAADFAGTVEEISRTVEFLQLVAAQAVERTRSEAPASRRPSAAPGWRTGWTELATDTGIAAADAGLPADAPDAADAPGSAPGPTAAAAVDDGYRNAAEFLRARLRIGIGEARRRLALAAGVLPQTGLTGQDLPARHELLAAALSTAAVPTRSATIISTALEQVRHHADPDTARQMEHSLTRTALESDPDFVHRTAKRWVDAIDQDGTEPGEEELRHRQGAFIRKPRHGLHHLEIFATAEQYETLATAMNTATNPRLQHTTDTDAADDGAADTGAHPALDRRSRAQKLLDGLTGACAAALTTGQLPANGGLRPQVMVTIDYQDLLGRLQHLEHLEHLEHLDRETPTRPGPRLSSGASTFQGPIHPAIIRKIACDADIIPVLLGSDSRVLDIGRTTRIFPPHIRKAIIARDQGCAFPDCTIPAPWCEAHHITYWSNQGTTGTDNGTLLCSHHHHVIHKEHWTITLDNGTAWFKPPPHLDPRQTPRRNHHFRPTRT